MKALIFDLDDTLVDTSAIRDARNAKAWKKCVSRLNETSCYPGIREVLGKLAENEIPIGIVTNSVSYYAERVLKYYKLPYDCLVCWHDTRKHKPDPAPVEEALKHLAIRKTQTIIGVGDHAHDCAAYVNAGIRAAGAGWSDALDGTADWHLCIDVPSKLLELLEL